MNSTHYSKLTVGLLALGLLLASVGVVAALTFSGDVTESAEVDDQERIEVTIENPYDYQDAWTVHADTGLHDASLELVAQTPEGQPTITAEGDGSVQLPIDISEDPITEIEVTVNGAVPPILQYDYENKANENVTGLEISDGVETIETWEIHRYTQGSQEARQAIDDASEVIEERDSDDARDRLDEAITFYNSGEFDDAIRVANDARDIAESEGETRQLLMIIGGLIVVAAAAGGIAYLYRTRQEPANKLQ